MTVFVLTWNPDGPGFTEAEYARALADPQERGRWSVGNRRGGITRGDIAMLFRQHHERGIVAVGCFADTIYDAPHWDGSQRMAHYADIDWRAWFDLADRLPVERLAVEVPTVNWDRLQSSGTRLRPPADGQLEALVSSHIPRVRGTALDLAEAPGSEQGHGGGAWTREEIRAVVEDYFEMLGSELKREAYSKTEHRNRLQPLLRDRSMQAIEYKHQNVSAVLFELGLPFINGYKPARNYQRALAEEIRKRLARQVEAFERLAESPAPSVSSPLRQTSPPDTRNAPPTGGQVDYEVLQAENRRLGAEGERLVVQFERDRLDAAGLPHLATRVRWVARDDGDGAGYDVLSFTPAGHEVYIEVKTTSLGRETPFYLSSAELGFAADHAHSYAIYRVYDLEGTPSFFRLDGDPHLVLDLRAVTYRAYLRAATEPPTRPHRRGEKR